MGEQHEMHVAYGEIIVMQPRRREHSETNKSMKIDSSAKECCGFTIRSHFLECSKEHGQLATL